MIFLFIAAFRNISWEPFCVFFSLLFWIFSFTFWRAFLDIWFYQLPTQSPPTPLSPPKRGFSLLVQVERFFPSALVRAPGISK